MVTKVEKKFQDRRNLFMEKVTELLLFYEWNNQLIRQVEEECKFKENYYLILFPQGINQIVEKFIQLEDQKMIEILQAKASIIKVREKLAHALKIRIKSCSTKKIAQKNYNYISQSLDLGLISTLAWQTCDHIWRYAGDQSTDFNYYSKRTLLMGVYLSAIAFYINDNSINYQETDNFIDESLTKIINIFNFKNIYKLPELENIPILRLFF